MPDPWRAHHQTLSNLAEEITVELDSAVSAGNWASVWDPARTGVVLGFQVDADRDVDTDVAAIAAAGHRVIQPPHLAFFGSRYAVVEDPDGNAVGVRGPIDETRRNMPELPS